MLGSFLRDRKWWLIGAAVLVVAGASFQLLRADDGSTLEDLERAQEAQEQASSASDRIVENLERIAHNLGAGANLTEQSSEIHDLTTKQRRSLVQLMGVLRQQLRALERTAESLEGTEGAAVGVSELGEEQLAVLRQTLGALERLETFAQDATRRSGELARQAIYGARLAEDSQRAFSGGP